MSGFLDYLKGLHRNMFPNAPIYKAESYQRALHGDTSMGAFRAYEAANPPAPQYNIPPPGTPGLPVRLAGPPRPHFNTYDTEPPPVEQQIVNAPVSPDTSVGAFRAYEAMNPPAPAPAQYAGYANRPHAMPPGSAYWNNMMDAPPPTPAPRRFHNQHVVGGSDVYNYTVEGTFPDMQPPEANEVNMGGSMNYKHPNTAQGEVNILMNPAPVASPMAAIMTDRATRRASMSAPVDIRRSDVMLDMPVRSPMRRAY